MLGTYILAMSMNPKHQQFINIVNKISKVDLYYYLQNGLAIFNSHFLTSRVQPEIQGYFINVLIGYLLDIFLCSNTPHFILYLMCV